MSSSKYFDKIAWTVTAVMLVVTLLFMNGSALGLKVMAHTMGYETRLFDNTRVHTVNIVMRDWDEFIDNATGEEYYTATLVIDGETYKNVGIRGKGNTSLSTVATMNSDRYSFKVEFDHYDNSITYHGLDKLSLNNLIQDSTMMKDYLTYTMMREFDGTSPLCSFVYITVNGEDWGLYLAVEGVEDSFLERNYGSNHGNLYKPDSLGFGGGRGNGRNFNMDDFFNREESSDDTDQPDQGMTRPQMPNMGNFDFSKVPGMRQDESDSDSDSENRNGFTFGGFGGFGGMGSSDVKLQYIDDDIDSYSNIWNNAKTKITSTDQKRLIESLKKLSSEEVIDTVVDIDKVIRYFAVHNYVCNGDSYTGQMIHNYYLYEENGQMAMIPWDYNLAFGTFQGGNAQSTINTPIDSPLNGGSPEDRPMWNWIVANEEYTELYHEYFAEFLNTVDIIGIIDNAYNLIKSYVEKDPTAFYTYEEFENGVETLRKFCDLRSESILMQLDNDETSNEMNYVNASSLTLSDMGTMRMGGGFGGGMPNRGENNGFFGRGFFNGNTPEDNESSPSSDAEESVFSGLNFRGTAASTTERSPQMPGGFNPPQMQGSFGGQMPEGFNGGFGGQMPGGANQTPPNNGGNPGFPGNNMQIPGGNFNFNQNGMENTSSINSDWVWIAVSVLILGVGLIIAKEYKY